MIQIQGQPNGSHDPKLKAPAVIERAGSSSEIAALRKEIDRLEKRVSDQDAKIAALTASLTAVPHETQQSQSESHADKPWLAAGVSRSTWFRKLKAKS